MRSVLTSIPSDKAALFLDLDGTLAPIAAKPEHVGPDRARNLLLRGLARALGGRLAIVSGRPIDDVDRVLQAGVMCVAGVHGLERRDATGRLHSVEPHPELDRVYGELEQFVRNREGLHLEFKMLGVALHFRQAPELGPEVMDLARKLAWTTGMKLQEGRMVVELRSPGADKGRTVLDYMAEAPFAGATPIFVGDDITDEDGFAAVRTLEGIGVLVGPWRTTQATARLRDVNDVLAWLGHGMDSGSFEIATEQSG